MKNAQTYRPLVLLLCFLMMVSGTAAAPRDIIGLMHLFMGGWFVTFSFFKILDLRGFASAYGSFDILAQSCPAYGMIYPFIEFGLALAYLGGWNPISLNMITASLMAVGLLGALRTAPSEKEIHAMRLCTTFRLPVSTLTVIENGFMLGMAVLVLIAAD